MQKGNFRSSRLLPVFLAVLGLLGSATLGAAGAEGLAQNPAGFYRLMVGDFEVITLSDGTNKRPVEQQLALLYGDRAKLSEVLAAAFPDGQINSTVNAFLINTGTKLMLIDAGNGRMGSPAMGQVVSNLRAAGYQPENVDEIYLTHMHGDHLGGLVLDGERVFPRATVYANKREAEYWLSDSNMNAAPEAARRTFQAAKTALAPYLDAGKFKTFESGSQLLPGIRAEALYGHTPGHTGYIVESKGQTIVLWGDVVHVAALQFADPTVTLAYDSDRTEAAQTRLQILADAAGGGWLIGGAHLPFPALVKVRPDAAGGYLFAPAE